jgi:predicted AAA+ superfamily ATPase
MQLVGVDWLSSDTREDDLSSRPGSIVQVFPFSFHSLLELEKILIIVKILLLKLLIKCALDLYLSSNMQQKVVQNSSLLSTCK